MNKNLFVMAAALALILPVTGCNKSGKLSQLSTFKVPSGPVELKLKWPLGERIEQDMDMKQTMAMTMPGQPGTMKQEMTMGQAYGLTVLQAMPDGGHEVEMDFISARMGATTGGKPTLDYDSTKKVAADKPNPVADVFGKIVGSKIRFFMDASNVVERVEGVDDMLSRLATDGNSAITTSLKGMYSEGYFKQMMSANRFMPPNAVQPGDTWPVQLEYPVAAMGTMMLDYTFTFQRWEMHGKRNCARLEFSGSITTKPDAKAKPGSMSFTILDGNSSGISWFDPELGKTIDTQLNQNMSMVIKMPMNTRKKAGAADRMQSITNQMTQVITIKLASVN